MSAESVIRQGRAFTESLMSSTCVITRASGVPVLNEATGDYETPRVTVYEGPCKLKFVSGVVAEVDAAGQLAGEFDGVLSLPIGVPGSGSVQVNDVAELTGNPVDLALVGTKARITRPHAQTFATARRFPVEVLV